MKKGILVSSLAILTLMVASQVNAQTWATAEPLYGTHAVNTGFMPDPMAIPVVAGGAETPQALAAPANCNGMITAAQPDVRINFTAGSLPLSFFVNSTMDTTLVVNAPDGSWHCNDDTNGLNPMVRFDTPQTGQYDIWIGIYGGANTAASNLLVSELTPMPLDCSTNAQGLAGDPGQQHFVTCPAGCTAATIWGTGIYSDDSSVCTAAVHTGAIAAPMGGTVSVTIAPGQPAYTPTTANGVTSSQWAAWSRSFTVEPLLGAAAPPAPAAPPVAAPPVAAPPVAAPPAAAATPVTCTQAANTFEGDAGTTLRVACPANCTSGSVWGTGIYSDDSSMCRAAIHMGIINQATGGEFNVTIAPGQPSYTGSSANGVTTSNWGSWSRSFAVTP